MRPLMKRVLPIDSWSTHPGLGFGGLQAFPIFIPMLFLQLSLEQHHFRLKETTRIPRSRQAIGLATLAGHPLGKTPVAMPSPEQPFDATLYDLRRRNPLALLVPLKPFSVR